MFRCKNLRIQWYKIASWHMFGWIPKATIFRNGVAQGWYFQWGGFGLLYVLQSWRGQCRLVLSMPWGMLRFTNER